MYILFFCFLVIKIKKNVIKIIYLLFLLFSGNKDKKERNKNNISTLFFLFCLSSYISCFGYLEKKDICGSLLAKLKKKNKKARGN